jgi:hypothetical protein
MTAVVTRERRHTRTALGMTVLTLFLEYRDAK